MPPEALDNPDEYVRRSVEESLQRLRVSRVALLQLHNGLTSDRDEEPAAVTPATPSGSRRRWCASATPDWCSTSA